MAYVNADTMVVPLSGVNHGALIFLPANTLPGVTMPQYSFADQAFIPVRPHIQSQGVVSKTGAPPKPREANIGDFFRGGSLDGQS